MRTDTQTLVDRLDTLGIAPEQLVVTHAGHDHVGGFNTIHVPGHREDIYALVTEDARRSDG